MTRPDEGLAELLVDDKVTCECCVEYLKLAEFGGKEEAEGRAVEWERRNGQVGEGVACVSRQNESDSGEEEFSDSADKTRQTTAEMNN